VVRTSDGVLPLPDICVTAPRAWQKRPKEWKAKAGAAWQRQGPGFVFSTRCGVPVESRNFHREFKKRAGKVKVPVIPVHATRKTRASLLVALDVHPRVAMQILRHSRIAVTMNVYSEVSSDATREALRRLRDSARAWHGVPLLRAQGRGTTAPRNRLWPSQQLRDLQPVAWTAVQRIRGRIELPRNGL